MRRSKWEAMKWCLLSSVCEPMAAILFGVLFSDFLTMHIMAALNAVVAGIMIILCVYELLPTALQYTNAKVMAKERGDGQNVAIATIAGQFVMFISLYFLIEVLANGRGECVDWSALASVCCETCAIYRNRTKRRDGERKRNRCIRR